MKKIISITVLVLVIVVASFVFYVLYTEMALVRIPVLVQKNPKITFIIGDAYYRESEDGEWKQAIVGKELKQGSQVKTVEMSQMDIRFHEGMAVRISEKSTFIIEGITVRKLCLKVESGSMFGKFEKLFKRHSIYVRTPTTLAAVRGTELGFEIIEIEEEDIDVKSGKDVKGQDDKDENSDKGPLAATRVYSLSGITEITNPRFGDQKILLSYQNKMIVRKDSPPDNPEELTEEEVTRIRSILNSIHTEEVLLISDKINFKSGSAKILPSSHAELDKIVLILNEKRVDIRIEGHTDSQGDAAFNQKLSVQRASSIRNYFIEKGIDPEKLHVAGFGLSKPVASNETAKGRALNRRVEFIIVE